MNLRRYDEQTRLSPEEEQLRQALILAMRREGLEGEALEELPLPQMQKVLKLFLDARDLMEAWAKIPARELAEIDSYYERFGELFERHGSSKAKLTRAIAASGQPAKQFLGLAGKS